MLMSVTPAVAHVLMSPYVIIAAAESVHHAPTAVCNDAVSVMSVSRDRISSTDGAFSRRNGAADSWANARGTRTAAPQKIHAARETTVDLVLVNVTDTRSTSAGSFGSETVFQGAARKEAWHGATATPLAVLSLANPAATTPSTALRRARARK